MALQLNKGLRHLLEESESVVETLTPQEAQGFLDRPGYCFVDLRDLNELNEQGTIPGAVHCSRGQLEFMADPDCDDANPEICSGANLILFCAGGLRSALAARTLNEMGFENLMHIGGGFVAWSEQGGAIEKF